MANVPLRAVAALLPEKWSSYLVKTLGAQVKNDPRGLVDAQMIADVLSRASSNDPERAVVERFLAVVRGYDQIAGHSQDVGTIAEYSPFETIVLKRRQDPDGEPAPSTLSTPLANTIDHLSGKGTRPAVVNTPGTEEQHPLDAELAALVLPSTSLVDLLAKSADRRQRDGNWISKTATRAIAQKLAKEKIPVHGSTFELSSDPGVVVFDKLTGGLLECIARHSFGGRKKLLALNAGATISDEMRERLTMLGATEIVDYKMSDQKQIGKIKETIKTWSGERDGEIETAIEEAGFTADSPLWSTSIDRLAALAQGGNIAVAQGVDGNGAAACTPLQKNVVAAASAGQLGTLLAPEAGNLFLTDIDKLSPEGQEALLDYLLKTANMSTTPGGLRAQRLVASTSRDLTVLAELGGFNKNLARILSPSTVKAPSLLESPQEIVPTAQAFLDKAYGAEDTAAAQSLMQDKAISDYLLQRFDGSYGGLKALMAKIAASSPADQPLSLELVKAQDEPLASRQNAILEALGELELATAGAPFKHSLAAALDALATGAARVMTVQGPELQGEVEKILESATSKLASSMGPVERIDVEALQGAMTDTVSPELVDKLAGGDPRSLILVSFENLGKDVQDKLVEKLNELRASGHIKGVLLPTSVDARLWVKEEFSSTLRWSMRAYDAIALPGPEEGLALKDRGALDQRKVDREKREKTARVEHEREVARELQERTGDQQVKVKKRAERGQPFEDLVEGLPASFVEEMRALMYDVRIEKWPAEIEACSKKGELFDALAAELIEAGKIRGKAVNEAPLKEARVSVLETRYKDWPEKIRRLAEAGEHFDTLIVEYRDAATKLGRKPNDGMLNQLTDQMRINLEKRAADGENFTTYSNEYKRGMIAKGAKASNIFFMQQAKIMSAKRVAEWPAKIQKAAEEGRDITTLKNELVEAWTTMQTPVDTAFLEQMTALAAQTQGTN